jgi:hypothetical protein
MRKPPKLLWDASLALLVLAAAAAVVRYLTAHDAPARDFCEAEVLQAIERLGGKVRRDENAPGKPVIAVFLNTPAMTDSGLEVLGELKQLRELDLTGSRVTASGLKELAGLQQLQTLHLGENPAMTDSGLEGLAELKQLRELDLIGSQVTVSGLKKLAGLHQLQTLHLGETQWRNRINDRPVGMNPGLEDALVRLRQLKTLYLNYYNSRSRNSRNRFNASETSWILEELQRWFQKHVPGCRVILNF